MKSGAKHHGLEQTLRVAREWYEDAPCTDRWRKSTSRWTQQVTSDHSSVALQMFQQCFWCSNSTLATCPYCWQVDILAFLKENCIENSCLVSVIQANKHRGQSSCQRRGLKSHHLQVSKFCDFVGFVWWLFVGGSNLNRGGKGAGASMNISFTILWIQMNTWMKYDFYRIVTIIILLCNYQCLSYTWCKADC